MHSCRRALFLRLPYGENNIVNIKFNAAAVECDQRRGKIVYKLKCDDKTEKFTKECFHGERMRCRQKRTTKYCHK